VTYPPVDADRYKGNDIDTDGDGQVNDANTVDGQDASDLGFSVHEGTGTVAAGGYEQFSTPNGGTALSFMAYCDGGPRVYWGQRSDDLYIDNCYDGEYVQVQNPTSTDQQVTGIILY
jgi:hypothetical protein